ncbi:MAG: beta-ketoacyl-ACP synthase II [Thermodesulfovibrionales bacterium]
MRRVVITGIGAVTPLAGTFHASWERCKAGATGIGSITRFDASGLPWKTAGEIKDFTPGASLSPKEALRHDPFVWYAVAASLMAVEDAGLRSGERADGKPALPGGFPDGAGILIGSSRGGISTMEREMERARRSLALSPYLMPASTISMAASMVAQKTGMRGTCLGISNACASGANAVGEAFRLVRAGIAPLLLAGGAEAPVCSLCVRGYGASGALSKIAGPSASRPFDRTRDGFVLAEGAAVLVIEELSGALRRGARIYAEIIGYSAAADAFHMTKPDPRGEARAVRSALEDAGVSPDAVDYINLHGTSTPLGDRAEAAAAGIVFGGRAAALPASALKSLTGHMLAASGAFEAACTAMTLKEGVIPPSLHLREKDPECPVALVTERQETPARVAVTQSFGFGGVNAVLVMRKA